MSNEEGTNRRDFLKTCVAGTIVLGSSDALAFGKSAKSRVVIAKDAMLRGKDSAIDPTRLSAMLDRAMQAFYGAKDALGPWKRLVRPGQVVGLKINSLVGPAFCTNPILVEVITQRLQQAGIKPYDIVIWDRKNSELEHAGFRLSSVAGRVRCMGSDAIGYEDVPEKYGVASCCLSKILTRTCDVVINVPMLKDHWSAGLSCSLKNMYGVINNPTQCHATGCNPAVADVNMLPTIRKKIIFTVCDATSACYHGGPFYKPEYVWTPDTLIVGSDRVALDSTAVHIIERKRAELGLKTLEAEGRPPLYLATAADAQHLLGTNDPKRISLLEV